MSTSHLQTDVRQQFYLDSVALMRMSRTLTAMAGVHDAAMMMATPANLEILSNADLLDLSQFTDNNNQTTIGPGDLILTVRADSPANASSALQEAENLLAQPQQKSDARQWQPRSIRSAVEHHPDANLALISVAGAFAVSEARKAIRRGLNTMIFSDNVPLEDELRLKQEARDLGVLVMGPDCGTCVINGVPLAFANKLPKGDIGIVGASGTGIQEVSCLLAGMDKGISHAIGVGGRDMSSEVGGISTLMALDALDADEHTRHIIVICKPPAPDVAAAVLSRIAQSNKTFTVCFIGGDTPDLSSNARGARTLTGAAEDAGGMAVQSKAPDIALDSALSNSGQGQGQGQFIRGLFCGGTLCAEAQVIGLDAGLALSSNVALAGVSRTLSANTHTLIDLGADEYTRGKPHPMIDPTIRDQLIQAAFEDKTTAVVLLDLVLGYGAHSDPAGVLLESLPDNYRTSGVTVVASVTGTSQDPQVRSQQIARLVNAGIQVAASNAQAALLAIEQLEADPI